MAKGRHSKLTPERQTKICDHLADGCTRRAACACSGISEDSFARYLAASADFADAIARAEADAENAMARVIHKAAIGGDWRAAENWLKRRRREDWGDNEKITHGGSLEFIAAASAEADAKFAASVARSREPEAENPKPRT